MHRRNPTPVRYVRDVELFQDHAGGQDCSNRLAPMDDFLSGISPIPRNGARFLYQGYPDRGLVRQLLGAITQFEKSLVAKLKAARDRKKAATGKCGVGVRTLRPAPRSWSMRCCSRVLGVTLRFWSSAQACNEFTTAFYRYGGKP
jgi:hypothetical protein